jgi:hypothetical protein
VPTVPYTLVSSPALAFDLVRLADGPAAATVLRVALQAGAAEVALLSARHPGPHRASRWDRLVAEPRGTAADTVHLAGPAVALAATGDTASSTVLRSRLEAAPIGHLAALDRFVRHEALEATWITSGDLAVQDPDGSRAADVLADAVAAAYCSTTLAPAEREAFSAPFDAARTAPEPTTGHGPADALLARLGAGDAAARTAWRSASAAHLADPAGWAAGMHEATWALSLSGRLRLAADAQLAAVAAFRRCGLTRADAAQGVWNAVSGALHATLVADLVEPRAVRVLTAPLRLVDDAERPGPQQV